MILDNVQYRKNYFQNRNKIRTSDGWAWITLPVMQPLVAPINEIKTDRDSPLRKRYTNLISNNYQHSRFFDDYFPGIQEVILSSHDSLADINLQLIRLGFDALGVKTPIVLASTLDVPRARGGTDVNLGICKSVGADTYLSGISGKDYLDCQPFLESGIRVEFQEFHHPIYRQMYEPFLPCMSVVDLLFNHGPRSLDILKGKGVEMITKVFE